MGVYCDPLIGYREWHDAESGSWRREEQEVEAPIFLYEIESGTQEQSTEELEREFSRLSSTWREETRNISSMTRVLGHPAYQMIIDMGPNVIPLLLREVQERPDHWFYALNIITGENPVKQEYAGNVKKMREAWVRWGKEHNYL
jgi:hypothetical protein